MKLEITFKIASEIVTILEDKRNNALSEIDYFKKSIDEKKQCGDDTVYVEEMLKKYKVELMNIDEMLKPFYEM